MGMIPKQTKAEKKVLKGLSVMRFIGLMMTIMLSSVISDLIGGWVKFIFIGFCIVVFFILTSKSPTDPNQSFAKGLITFLSFAFFEDKVMYGSSNIIYKQYYEKKEEKKSEKKTIGKNKKKREKNTR